MMTDRPPIAQPGTVRQLTLEPDPQIPLPIACEQCGATDDLVTEWERVYSHRYREVTRCRLRPACWDRWERRRAAGVS